jgi:hypothetical protein
MGTVRSLKEMVKKPSLRLRLTTTSTDVRLIWPLLSVEESRMV